MSNTDKIKQHRPLMNKLSLESKAIEASFNHYLTYFLGRSTETTPTYAYNALSLTLRDRIMADWRNTSLSQKKPGVRRAYYVSLEFLIGRALGNHLLNLDVEEPTRQALESMAFKLEDVEQAEHDAGLGNGGLGRLAACFSG